MTNDMLIAAAGSGENLAALRALQIGSFMTVPLIAHDELLGAITYISPNHGDSFAVHDQILAEDLAARCATAIENSRNMDAANEARNAAARAQKKAEDANVAKMRFLSTMSHELRTPLNAIAGYAALLQEELSGPLTEEQLHYTSRIISAEQHLLSLVESVLDYAKIDAGHSIFGLKDVLVADMVNEIEAIIAPLVAEKNIAWATDDLLLRKGLTVYADPEKLKQLLLNLISNAIKFTPEYGTIEMTEEDAGERIEIHIADSGVGIAPEHQKKVFEPFVQVEDGLDRSHSGTGLGLAISRELASGMGGHLSLESRLGKGSVFTLTLARGRGT